MYFAVMNRTNSLLLLLGFCVYNIPIVQYGYGYSENNTAVVVTIMEGILNIYHIFYHQTQQHYKKLQYGYEKSPIYRRSCFSFYKNTRFITLKHTKSLALCSKINKNITCALRVCATIINNSQLKDVIFLAVIYSLELTMSHLKAIKD